MRRGGVTVHGNFLSCHVVRTSINNLSIIIINNTTHINNITSLKKSKDSIHKKLVFYAKFLDFLLVNM
jgi:hypothetical protein